MTEISGYCFVGKNVNMTGGCLPSFVFCAWSARRLCCTQCPVKSPHKRKRPEGAVPFGLTTAEFTLWPPRIPASWHLRIRPTACQTCRHLLRLQVCRRKWPCEECVHSILQRVIHEMNFVFIPNASPVVKSARCGHRGIHGFWHIHILLFRWQCR